jgi:hypothetical protein
MDDGAVACVETGDGLTVHVDSESELNGWCGSPATVASPEVLLADAIRERIERSR